jgi:hypothetical protein
MDNNAVAVESYTIKYTVVKQSFLGKIKKWILNYIKYNVAGTVAFLVGSLVYSLLLYHFLGGFMSYYAVAPVNGGIEFSLLCFMQKFRFSRVFG